MKIGNFIVVYNPIKIAKKMKTKTQPTVTNSGNYLEQSLMKGLNKTQEQYAKSQVKKYSELGLAIPYGIIRKTAINL